MAQTQTTPSLETLEALLDEACEQYREVEDRCRKLHRLERASDAYFYEVAQIAADVTMIQARSASILRQIDALEDATPDD
ncbi:MAG TPA: hypothetical protein VGW33_00325 [Terriglobia bacterium]|nr:hypothetical protein [Terriglobia bacterium]